MRLFSLIKPLKKSSWFSIYRVNPFNPCLIFNKNLDTNSDAKISESSYLIESMNQNLNSIIKAFIVVISLDGYLMFLWFLHPILGLQKEKKHVSEDT